MQEDSFTQNIAGVTNLIQSDVNKSASNLTKEEGAGQQVDLLELNMSDKELLDLKSEWEIKSAEYTAGIKRRQEKNKLYYLGKQRSTQGEERVVPDNLIFEAEETFLPQALSKNPEPVVWSDNTEEGKKASDQIKSMLQYHADILCLRKKLGVMVRHWSIYFLGVVKHGWDDKVKEIKTDVRKPQNFILDPEGYVDEYGNYIGSFLGEKIETSAERMIELFPKSKDYIIIKVNGKLGTKITRTEWWTDDYCFSTYGEVVLDKHKNEYFNYGEGEQVINHFATPKMPYTFLSVFSLQEKPHDVTNLIEQNIPNQDQVNDRDEHLS